MRLGQSPADAEADFISSRTSDSTFHFGHSSISATQRCSMITMLKEHMTPWKEKCKGSHTARNIGRLLRLTSNMNAIVNYKTELVIQNKRLHFY